MSASQLMLGGIAIQLQAGAIELTEQAIGGESSVRLSNGALVTMRHFEKMSGTISASGWMPPGLDGLDYSGPLELRSTKVRTQQGAGPTFNLQFTPRADKAPWAFAVLSDNRLVPVACSTVARVVTVATIPGALAYQVWAMPQYSVKCSRPTESQGTQHGWSISWEEF